VKEGGREGGEGGSCELINSPNTSYIVNISASLLLQTLALFCWIHPPTHKPSLPPSLFVQNVNVLGRPLAGGGVVPSPVRAVELGDLGHQRVVGVGVRQEGADGEEDLRQGREGGREGGRGERVCMCQLNDGASPVLCKPAKRTELIKRLQRRGGREGGRESV